MSSDEIYEDMCSRIIKLEFLPGEKISENDLSSQYGVSRHVVRSAITRLRDRKLVDVYPQRGTFVSLIDMKYVETVLYLRESVEHEAVLRLRNVSEECLEQMIDEMEQNLAEQKKAIENGVEMEAFYEIDTEFHRCFMKAVGQRDVMDLVRDPFMHVKRWRNFEVRRESRLMELYHDHEELLSAIRQRKFDQARDILHVHLNTVERLQDIFKRTSPEYFIFR